MYPSDPLWKSTTYYVPEYRHKSRNNITYTYFKSKSNKIVIRFIIYYVMCTSVEINNCFGYEFVI